MASNSCILHRASVALLLFELFFVATQPSLASFGGGNQMSLNNDALVVAASKTCNGLVGDCIDEEEEGMMESETSRRVLRPTAKYISYEALKKNNVPCNRRGRSYYTNCQKGQPANPYRRGCSVITNCKRHLDY